VKAGWRLERLAEVAKINSGESNTQDAIAEGEYTFFDRSKVAKRSSRYIYDCEALIIPGEGTEFLPRHFTGKFDLHQRAYAIHTFSNDILPRYLYYFLIYRKEYWPAVAVGATVKSLRQRHFENLKVTIAPLEEQRRIVAILDEAFAAIATAIANAEKNQQNARELFGGYRSSIFTDGNNIWPTRPICEFANVFDGPHATPKTVDAGPIFLGISALKDGTVDLSETRHVTTNDFKTWTRRVKPRPGDVVFSYETRLGQVAIIPEGLDCCLGRRMGLVRCEDSIMDPRFFVHQYLAAPFQEFLMSRAIRGATVDRISVKEFPAFQMRVPALTEQRRIIGSLDKLAKVCGTLEAKYREKMAALANLKLAILGSAFAGELTALASVPLDIAAE
jgi:type I restriction enzyme S subunit